MMSSTLNCMPMGLANSMLPVLDTQPEFHRSANKIRKDLEEARFQIKDTLNQSMVSLMKTLPAT